jgi:hypothetical protein
MSQLTWKPVGQTIVFCRLSSRCCQTRLTDRQTRRSVPPPDRRNLDQLKFHYIGNPEARHGAHECVRHVSFRCGCAKSEWPA